MTEAIKPVFIIRPAVLLRRARNNREELDVIFLHPILEDVRANGSFTLT